MYVVVGRWVDIDKVWKMMKERGLKKTSGCTWIEVHKEVHTFFIGDSSPLKMEKIST